MPEGDTLARTAAGLRPYLVGRVVESARAQGPGSIARVDRIVGTRIEAVDALGKNLLIRFDNGLELRTHLRMNGSWHRYRPGERWRRPRSRARLVLQVPGAVAVCFDAPVIELLEQRAESVYRPLAELGPDVLAPDFEVDGAAEALRRLRAPGRARRTIAEALVDQRALAGIGNIYKSEALFAERIDPFVLVAQLGDEHVERVIATAVRLLAAAAGSSVRPSSGASSRRQTGPIRHRFAVYRRTGLPCRRCGTPIASRVHGELPRRTYWCPRCQTSVAGPTLGDRGAPLPVAGGLGE